MGSGTLIQFTAQGYGAARATDIAFYTSAAGGVNSTPALYMTGGNNVGIGTGTLSARLTIVSLTGETLRLISVDTAGDNYMSYHNSAGTRQGYVGYGASATDFFQIVNESNSPMAFYTNGTSRLTINNTGEVGIGLTASTGNIFMVRGNSNASGDTSLVIQNLSATNLLLIRNDGAALLPIVASSWTTGSAANLFIDSGTGQLYRSTSSLKYKTDVLDYNKGLDIIKQMRPVYYKGINDGNTQFAGFIAEEINNLGLNEFVQYAEDGSPDALAYSNMTALLTKGIQQLDTRLTNVEDALLTLQQNLN
jgi:hypothetical protein